MEVSLVACQNVFLKKILVIHIKKISRRPNLGNLYIDEYNYSGRQSKIVNFVKKNVTVIPINY